MTCGITIAGHRATLVVIKISAREWNECLLANACKTTNTCTVRNKCDGTVNNIPPCSASDTCPSGNTCSFMDWPCYWCNTCDAPG